MTRSIGLLLLAGLVQAQSDWPSYGNDPGAMRFSAIAPGEPGECRKAGACVDVPRGQTRVGSDSDCRWAESCISRLPTASMRWCRRPGNCFGNTRLRRWRCAGWRIGRGRGAACARFRGERPVSAGAGCHHREARAGIWQRGPRRFEERRAGRFEGRPNTPCNRRPRCSATWSLPGAATARARLPRALTAIIRGWDAKTGKLLWTFHTVPRPGEAGIGDLACRRLEESLGDEHVGLLHRRREARHRLCAARFADLGFLRRRSRGRRPVRELAGSARCAHGEEEMAPAAGASRPLGLRSGGAAGAVRYPSRRAGDSGGRADHQDGPAVRLRPGDRRARVRHGGARRAADSSAGRGDVEDAAVSGEAAAAGQEHVPHGGDVRPVAESTRASARSCFATIT